VPHYLKVKDYIQSSREFLQDMVEPYRYSDGLLVEALNNAMFEISRVRPDIFIDFKFQQPLPRYAPITDNIPQIFSSIRQNETVPIPSQLSMSVKWYISGLMQFYDVDDTQDARAAAFNQKFQGALMTLAT